MAVRPRAASDFACFIFCSQAELEELRWCALSGVAVVECQRGEQLIAFRKLAHQVLFERADHQLYASGLGLAIEVVDGLHPRAVIQLDA